MIKRIIINCAVLIFMLSAVITAGAADLPIDIDIIGQDGGSGEAHTANVNVEILTPNANEITKAINEYNRQNREMLIFGLFTADGGDEALSKHEQVVESITDSALFSQPSNYTGMRMINEDNSIPVWVIIVLFATSITAGFILAYIIMHRKRGQEQDVH